MREVTISTVFLKLIVQIIGKANPIITKRIKALKYIKGMKNYPEVEIASSVVFLIIFTVLYINKASTSKP